MVAIFFYIVISWAIAKQWSLVLYNTRKFTTVCGHLSVCEDEGKFKISAWRPEQAHVSKNTHSSYKLQLKCVDESQKIPCLKFLHDNKKNRFLPPKIEVAWECLILFVRIKQWHVCSVAEFMEEGRKHFAQYLPKIASLTYLLDCR